MFLRIETLPEKKFVGIMMTMSFAQNKTGELWRSFMPRRHEITTSIGTVLYSIERYSPHFFDQFDPAVEFEKWAAIEVQDFEGIPQGMETITAVGLYAVFLHVGLVTDGPKTYNYIFSTWLPNSEYVVDQRPHFAVMGEKYKHDDLNSEEEIWIPVKKR